MNYLKTPIEGVYIIEPHRFADPRGYFMETMKLAEFRENVAPGIEFVQANESVSSRGFRICSWVVILFVFVRRPLQSPHWLI